MQPADMQPASSGGDVFELLKRDHARVSQLLADLEGTPADENRRREQLFERLIAEIETHSQAEDDVLYSTLEQIDNLEDLIDEARQEHDLIEETLEEMDGAGVDGDEWIEKLREVRQLIQHHVDMEEGRMFTMARRHLDVQTCQRLAVQLRAAKDAAQTELSGERAMITEEAPEPGEAEVEPPLVASASDLDRTDLDDRNDVDQLSKKELYELARLRHIGGRSSMTKAELVEAIRSAK